MVKILRNHIITSILVLLRLFRNCVATKENEYLYELLSEKASFLKELNFEKYPSFPELNESFNDNPLKKMVLELTKESFDSEKNERGMGDEVENKMIEM